MIESVEYIANGRNSYARWFNRLNRQASARVAKALARMKDGNFSNTRGVGAGAFECRIETLAPAIGSTLREGDVLIILLGGGTKQRQQWECLARIFETMSPLFLENAMSVIEREPAWSRIASTSCSSACLKKWALAERFCTITSGRPSAFKSCAS